MASLLSDTRFFEENSQKADELRKLLDSKNDHDKLQAMKRIIAVCVVVCLVLCCVCGILATTVCLSVCL